MVYVPAGEFLMGSTSEDIDAAVAECVAETGLSCEREWFVNELPQHTAYLDAFWIDQREVTNAQYRQCVDAGACKESDCGENHDAKAPDQPVVCVSWDDAQAYAAWVGGRLPTEAEWEKAARGRDGRVYPWGNSPLDCDKAVYAACADQPLPVGTHPEGASTYGAEDMLGNVWEWVADWIDDEYYARSPERNPQGPDSGDRRVWRGGSFTYYQWVVRCAVRGRKDPNSGYPDGGFRVLVLPGDR